MDYITFTQLRTQAKELAKALEQGKTVSLIHRSKIIGVIKPESEVKVLQKTDIEEIKQLANKLNLPKMSYSQRDRAYRKHLLEKYGKGIS